MIILEKSEFSALRNENEVSRNAYSCASQTDVTMRICFQEISHSTKNYERSNAGNKLPWLFE
jgi:hypothetical protein